MQKIRLALRERGLGAVRVGTVDDYQGQEERIIFISTVRALSLLLLVTSLFLKRAVWLDVYFAQVLWCTPLSGRLAALCWPLLNVHALYSRQSLTCKAYLCWGLASKIIHQPCTCGSFDDKGVL